MHRFLTSVWPCLLVVLCVPNSPLSAQFAPSHAPVDNADRARSIEVPPPSTKPVGALAAVAWREDLAQLRDAVVTHHAEPFNRVDQADFDAAVSRLNTQIPQLSRDQILVEFTRIVALIGDGHTAIALTLDPAVGFWALPIRLAAFDDGIFVESARDTGAAVGARVLEVEGRPIAAALEALKAVISHENEMWPLAQAPAYLVRPQILYGLGLSSSPASVQLTLQRKDGVVFRQRWDAEQTTPENFRPFWLPPTLNDKWHHAVSFAADATPLALKAPRDNYWLEHLAESKTLYVQLNALQNKRGDHGQGESVRSFFSRVEHLASQPGTERLVLDLRRNVGGNGVLAKHIVRCLVRLRQLDDPRKLFVLIGRHTYSAGQQLVNETERFTNATFVGEPTGTSPNSYGDHVDVRLEHSGVEVRVAPVWHQSAGPFDQRAWTAPDVAAPPLFDLHVAGVDPAFEAIDAWLELPSIDRVVSDAMANGGATGQVERALREFQAEPVNRYRNLSGELNRIGYELWGSGDLNRALALFRINIELHSDYANGFDSLGEALQEAGDLAGARTAFSMALEIDASLEATAAKLRLVEHLLARQ